MARHRTALNTLHTGILLTGMALLSGPCHASPGIRSGLETMEVATYEQSPTLQLYQRFIKEAYLRLGITTRYTDLPILRAAYSANEGRLDAILIASTGAEAGADNMVRVANPLPEMTFRLVARVDMPGETLPADLGPYSVAYIHGIHPLERQFADKKQTLTTNSNMATLAELLELKRVDLVALPSLEANLLVQRRQGLKVLQEPVYTFSVFHYVHQNHKDLAATLADTFRKLKHDGCMEAITRVVMNNDLNASDDTLLDIVNAPDYQPLCPAASD
ncbi:hypothetical protein ACFOZ5_03805 [Marinobacter lacisalsi]|uniref:Solute-binding protein family 3/N-terminal domain-containing protein n=1 Tax=Marinobacter lacisalsi TaxID=475979 RepID=A0ABV8QGE2_9GAMM